MMHPTLFHSLVIVMYCLIDQASGVQQVSFCMLTAQRPGNVSYLEQVVGGYQLQHIDHMDGIGLILVDTDGSTLGQGVPLSPRVLAVCDTPDVEGLPSCRVRQRTLDATGALNECARSTSGWVVLVEDDYEPCPGALDEVLAALSRLATQTTSMAKFSRNFGATAFPVTRIPAYVSATLERLYTHPHDIVLADEWSPPPVSVYQHPVNLFHHIGFVSTEHHKNAPEWRDKYDSLRADSCFDATV